QSNRELSDVIWARRNGTAWTLSTAASQQPVTRAALLTDSAGSPRVLYTYNDPFLDQGGLRYLRFNGTSWTTTTLETGIRGYADVSGAISPVGGGSRIAYVRGNQIRYVQYVTSWQFQTVEAPTDEFSTGGVGLAVDGNGNPSIAYATARSNQIQTAGTLKL